MVKLPIYTGIFYQYTKYYYAGSIHLRNVSIILPKDTSCSVCGETELLLKDIMKIDLYNNTETFIKESKQDSAIRKWSYKHGISIDYLMDHPCIKDVAFLLEFRDEFQKEYKTSKLYTASYTQYWRNTYCLKKPLKPKAFRKFEIMAQHCLAIRQQQEQQKDKIQSLRQRNRDLPQ